MNRYRYIRGAVIPTVLQCLFILANTSLVQAQDASPSPEPSAAGSGELQQVVVTGTLIPRAGEGPQPVTTYDQTYIQNTGYQSVADVLQNLPAAAGNFNPGVTTGFGFSPGGASIALKGLPPNDTLVLVDGLRMPSYPFPQESTAATINYVDINSIPTGAVDRVDFLNDGGSATYGTDAVAGVVNFALKDQYNGGMFSITSGSAKKVTTRPSTARSPAASLRSSAIPPTSVS